MGIESQFKQIIDDRGIKQAWIARKAGVSTTTITSLAKGRSVPELETALRIAAVLDLPVEAIWRLPGNDAPDRS